MCTYPGCRVRSEKGESLCILHLPIPKATERFRRVIYSQLDGTGTPDERNDRFNFSGYDFPCGIRASDTLDRNKTADIVLPSRMTHCDFDGASISGNVQLSKTVINRDCRFWKAEILGDVYLDRAEVGGSVSFRHAEISGKASLATSTVGGDVDFRDAQVCLDLVMSRATVQGALRFEEAVVQGTAFFRKATVGAGLFFVSSALSKGAYFSKASVQGRATFENARIGGPMDFSYCLIECGDRGQMSDLLGLDVNFVLAQLDDDLSFFNADVRPIGGSNATATVSSGRGVIVGFHKTKIGGDLLLLQTTLDGKLYAKDVSIRGRMCLGLLEVCGDLHLEGICVEESCMCRHTSVGGAMYLYSATFGQKVSIIESRVAGVCRMAELKVSGDLCFENCWLRTGIQLPAAEIDGSLTLKNLSETGLCDFDSMKLRGSLFFTGSDVLAAYLQEADIGGAAILEDVSVDGDVNLFHARIGGSLRFVGSRVGGSLSLQEIHVARAAQLGLGKLGGALNCKDSELGTLTMPESSVGIGKVDFDGCRARHLVFASGDPVVPGLGKARPGVALLHIQSSPSFWRFAQRMLDSEGKRDAADAAFYLERSTRLAPERVRHDYSNEWRRNFFLIGRRVISEGVELMDKIFLRWPIAYGSSLVRLSLTWSALVVGFALAYFVLDASGIEVFSVRSAGLDYGFTIGRALYFSIITFTTLGYGDLQPAAGVGSALCSLEAILGGISMALTVLVIGRKFMR